MKRRLLLKKSLSQLLIISVLATLFSGISNSTTLAEDTSFQETIFENFQGYDTNYSANKEVTPNITDSIKRWTWNDAGATGNLSFNSVNTDFNSIGGTKSMKFGFNNAEQVVLNNPNNNQRFDYSKDGFSFWANSDNDQASIFTSNAGITTNTDSIGLKDSDSVSSIKISLPGWGYPKFSFAGDMTGNKSVKFWVLAKTNDYSNGFTGPDVPISNMTTGVTLGTAKLNEWVQITIDFASMSGNSFGFLQDRAPLNLGSLDLYFDNIEFIQPDLDDDYLYFSINGYADYMSNTDSVGLHGTGSAKSAKVALGGWGYPTLHIEGDVSKYTAISFWALAKTNQYSNGFAGPDVPISNMTTGALLGTAKFDEWVQITINLSSMTGNSFGFICSQAPLNQGGLDLYIDGVQFIGGDDSDVGGLFTASGPLNIYTNTNSAGLYGTESTTSAQFNLGGYAYPTVTVNGDMSSYKSIRFWAMVRTNTWSGDFTGPDVPFSNMSTGATLANAKLNEWVQITIDFSNMSGNKFGFLQDREPLINHSVDIFLDEIEFIPFEGSSTPNLAIDGSSYLKMSICSADTTEFSTNIKMKNGWNKYYIPYSAFVSETANLRELQETENYFYNLKFEFKHNMSGTLYNGAAFESANRSLLLYIDDIGFYSGNPSFDTDIEYYKPITLPVSFDNYTISEDNIITDVQPGTTNEDFITSLNPIPDLDIVITNSDPELGIVGTGSTIDIPVNDLVIRYTVLIYGDLDGDGAIGLLDLISYRNMIIGKDNLEGILLKSTDLNKDGNTGTLIDLLMVKSIILK